MVILNESSCGLNVSVPHRLVRLDALDSCDAIGEGGVPVEDWITLRKPLRICSPTHFMLIVTQFLLFVGERRGSRELDAGLADLHAEAHYPVCKEYFKNAVTMECGHQVCIPCISVFLKDLKGIFPCPSCHLNHPGRNVLSNQAPGELTVDAILSPKRTNGRKRQDRVCSCGESQQVSCPLHSFPSSHPSHYVWPTEIATLCHRKQIDCYIKLWREMVEPVQKAITTQRGRSLELKKRAECIREEMRSQYEQNRLFLQDEREKILGQLQSEEMDGLAKLDKNLMKLSDHASSLKSLLKELKSQCVKPELALLASAKDWYERYTHSRWPEIASVKLKRYDYRLPLQYSDLDRITKRFQVDVILDPETANYSLKVSKDKKTVNYGSWERVSYSPRRFCFDPAVLGSEGYSSDRQYWEVDVELKTEWLLGVCREPFPRSRNHEQLINEQFSVQDGLWGVGLGNLEGYVALGLKKISLLPKVAPNRIGIFLDSEMHEVSFYNLRDKSLLHRFSDCPAGTFWPYFYTGYDYGPLRVCTAVDVE
ncbi:tripartite motif-containing protein 60-like [Apodemus sylvaticus]|uniref:tripartite motif-containing protein 60-like n=1 Tax=Apodemus sylvaticus TaxID=10129 RepID=UPI002243001B|nr:tripartite motif-containing protein 60-like [Apodemus sylvaticus]